jgi:Mn2+/Fe2+ NRAMP family transporter
MLKSVNASAGGNLHADQMRRLLGITLGIMTALGGFVDFGQIVFTLQAGASFRYALLWPIVPGTAAIIVYMEMCGRIAVIAREPVFAIVRDRLGKRMGLTVLVASNLLNLITCAAELGAIAIVLHLLTGRPEKMLLAGAGWCQSDGGTIHSRTHFCGEREIA